MLRILVRSKRDLDAVKAALRIFNVSDVAVESLGGARGGRLVERILEEAEPFTLVLLGNEDREVASVVDDQLPPFSGVIVSKTRRIRNSTVEQILSLIDRGRALIRLTITWNGSYRLSRSPRSERLEVPPDPQGDSMILSGRSLDLASEVLGKEVSDVAIMFKLSEGVHKLFLGPNEVAEVWIGKRFGELEVRWVSDKMDSLGVDLSDVVENNRDLLRILEERAIKSLRGLYDEVETVIVPWSGGKDSTASLVLAVEAFGRDRVRAAYVDTGVDFPENLEYIEEVSSMLKIDYHIYRADVAEKVLNKEMPLPSPENRWCTYRKLLALRRGFKELSRGKTVVVVGDRDAESDARARRPMVRIDESGLPLVAPIKLWSAAHVEAYLLHKGVPLNPLYRLGFYRIGCYICFSLRSWELSVMFRNGLIDRILRLKPEHKGLIQEFLRSKGLSSVPLKQVDGHS